MLVIMSNNTIGIFKVTLSDIELDYFLLFTKFWFESIKRYVSYIKVNWLFLGLKLSNITNFLFS
jgi:hypothetical protein